MNWTHEFNLQKYFKLKAAILVLTGVIACSFLHRRPAGDPYEFTAWVSEVPSTPLVAILPFTNKTNQADLSELVRAGFYGHFSPLPFKDLEISEIDRALSYLEKYQKKPFQGLSSTELGSLLGAQALIYGEVTKFTKVYAGIYSQIGVGAEIRIIDTNRGRIIWNDSYFTTFHEGNIPMTQVIAVFSLVKTGLNLRTTQELRTIDDLCRNLVARIPDVSFPEKVEKSFCEVQVAAFKDFNRAQDFQKELQKKKYKAFIRTVEDGGIIWHRVVLGPFDCGQETDQWKEKITADFGYNPIVVKIQETIHSIIFRDRKE